MIAAALHARRPHELELGAYVVVKLDSAVQDVEERLVGFEKWKNKLVERDDIPGGEPTFPRSRLAVRHIGEMARRGASAEDIVSDYPKLSKQDVEFAKRYVAAYPRVGRHVFVKLLLDENISPAAAVALAFRWRRQTRASEIAGSRRLQEAL
jgi:uncharacterized protein (DUF433 family)